MARHLVLQILGLYLDKLEKFFELDPKDLLSVYRERAFQSIRRGGYGAAIENPHTNAQRTFNPRKNYLPHRILCATSAPLR